MSSSRFSITDGGSSFLIFSPAVCESTFSNTAADFMTTHLLSLDLWFIMEKKQRFKPSDHREETQRTNKYSFSLSYNCAYTKHLKVFCSRATFMWVVSSHIHLSINYKTDSKRRASRKIDKSSHTNRGRGVKCRTVDR